MNHLVKMALIGVAASIVVAGCGISSASANPSKSPSASTPSNSVQSSASKTSTSSTPSGLPQSSTNISPGTPVSTSSPTTASDTSTAGINLVKAWMQSGLTGQGLNMPIGDQKNIAAVQKVWGPGHNSSAGAGIYVSYPAHDVAFGINQGEQIFDVRSYAPSVTAITRADVTAALGPPAEVRYASNTTIYLYPDQLNYQVLWVFSGGPGHTGDTVNHVDVVWPQGTVNLMAATQPAPSVVVTQNTRLDLRFAIRNAPTGYHLTELEWVNSPGSGAYAVNTYFEARENAHYQGTSARLFMASGSHFRFQYPAGLVGTKGRLRLIYESPAGTASIGTSPSITLK